MLRASSLSDYGDLKNADKGSRIIPWGSTYEAERQREPTGSPIHVAILSSTPVKSKYEFCGKHSRSVWRGGIAVGREGSVGQGTVRDSWSVSPA